jgi:hypothetical protein
LVGKTGYAFAPNSEDAKKLVKDASALTQAKFVWAFKYIAKEASLNPYGIVLCTTKQVIVSAKGRSALN